MADNQTLRLVLLGLIVISSLAIGGLVITATAGREPPQVLGTLAATATGALVGLMVPPGWSKPRNGNGPSSS